MIGFWVQQSIGFRACTPYAPDWHLVSGRIDALKTRRRPWFRLGIWMRLIWVIRRILMTIPLQALVHDSSCNQPLSDTFLPPFWYLFDLNWQLRRWQTDTKLVNWRQLVWAPLRNVIVSAGVLVLRVGPSLHSVLGCPRWSRPKFPWIAWWIVLKLSETCSADSSYPRVSHPSGGTFSRKCHGCGWSGMSPASILTYFASFSESVKCLRTHNWISKLSSAHLRTNRRRHRLSEQIIANYGLDFSNNFRVN